VFSQYVSPWVTLTDDCRYQETADRVERLHPTVMVGRHTPAISGGRIAAAIDVTRRTPNLSVAPQPDQSVLEEIQCTLTGLAA
jgi:hypothetical protein